MTGKGRRAIRREGLAPAISAFVLFLFPSPMQHTYIGKQKKTLPCETTTITTRTPEEK